jgi:hypothetical protein
MTIPIRPNSGFLLAQALGKGIGAFTDARTEALRRKREEDLQNIALWQQILPGLTNYVAPVQTAPVELGGGLPPIPAFQGAEMFGTPTPPAPIAQSLQRLTGQSSMGVSPQVQDSIRQNALSAKTFVEAAKRPALENAATAAGIKATEAGTKRTEVATQKDAYDLSTAPARDTLAYAFSAAPSYVAAAVQSGLAPTRANAPRIIEQAWQQFQTNDNSPWKQGISKELFAKALQDQIDDAEKMGLERWALRIRQMEADKSPDPKWAYIERSADNYRQLLGNMDAQRSRLMQAIPGFDEMMLTVPEMRNRLSPEGQQALDAIKMIDEARPGVAERQQRMQNMIDAQFGGMNPLAASPTPARDAAMPVLSIDQHRAGLRGLGPLATKISARAYILNAVRQGVMTPVDAIALGKEYRINLSEADFR